MIDAKAKIMSNKKVAPDFFRIAFEAHKIAKRAKPGQFVMVRCRDKTEPLLRRPFSFHRISKTGFELLYKVVGIGTKILSQRKEGEVLEVLGPLGNGFDMNKAPSILVAGGTGIAPLLALAEKLKTFNTKLTVLIGARTKEHILSKQDFKNLNIELVIATEDGSEGRKGLVTELVKNELRITHYASRITIYACGPRPMLRAVANFAKSKKIPCQVSLEEKVACGTGACLGCAVETKTGYKMVCKDGPVFNGEDIIW